jgi:hypothetical protein
MRKRVGRLRKIAIETMLDGEASHEKVARVAEEKRLAEGVRLEAEEEARIAEETRIA